MSPLFTQLTLAGQDGHIGTFSYELSDPQGWNVRAEVDHRVVLERHCRTWRGVEHLYDRLRATLK